MSLSNAQLPSENLKKNDLLLSIILVGYIIGSPLYNPKYLLFFGDSSSKTRRWWLGMLGAWRHGYPVKLRLAMVKILGIELKSGYISSMITIENHVCSLKSTVLCVPRVCSLVFYIIEFLQHVLSGGSEHPTHRGKGELYGAGTTTSPVSSKQ